MPPESAPREIHDEGPTLIGRPHLSGMAAYRRVIDGHPLVSIEESDILGAQIYEGTLAARALTIARINEEALQSEHRATLENTAAQGLAARKIMATRHLRLVGSLAGKFSKNYGRYDEERASDMIGAGNIALMECMKNYVHQDGRHFAAFAKQSILNGMLSELARQVTDRTGMSQEMQRDFRVIDLAHRTAVAAGEEVNFVNIGVKLGYSVESIEKMLTLRRTSIASLDAPLRYGDAGQTLGSTLERIDDARDIDHVENRLVSSSIWKTAFELRRRDVLTTDEWLVFSARFKENLSLDTTARKYFKGRTASSMHPIEKRVLGKIRRGVLNPESYEKTERTVTPTVTTATELLQLLDIPVTAETDILTAARSIIDTVPLTERQRETMHGLLGTKAERMSTSQLAYEQGVKLVTVYNSRKRALTNILKATLKPIGNGEYTDVSAPQGRLDASRAPEAILQAAESGARPVNSFQRMSPERLLMRALKLKPTGTLTRKEIIELAMKGDFADMDTLKEKFISLSEFQALCKQLRRARR